MGRDRRGQPGRRRAPGKRGATGSGVYPVLARLGIAERATPKVRLLAAYQMVMGDCYRESLTTLAEMGLAMDDKVLVRYGQHVARALVARRDERLESYLKDGTPGPLAGQVVQVSIDGGRVKVRRNNRQGRRKKNGRRGFVTEWREPKGFIIQVLDENGKPHKEFLPFIDFTLGDCEAMYRLLSNYLKALGAGAAERVVFVCDGAEWIWNRVDALFADVGLPADRLIKLVDFYHVCEYLSMAAQACTTWSEPERRELYAEFKKWLRHSKQIHLTANLRELEAEFGAEPISDALRYLKNHKDYLDYAKAREHKLPIGSGAIESAIRRVVNQRFKAPGTIWLEENIEPLLHLRAIIKAGRFNDATKDRFGHLPLFELDEEGEDDSDSLEAA